MEKRKLLNQEPILFQDEYGLKEIKESRINLKIIKHKPVVVHEKVDKAFKEANELMAIFLKSVETARKNRTFNS